MKFLKKIIIWRILAGLFLGSLAGFAYYYFIGCSSGSCPITSNPVNMTLYGAFFGVLLFYKTRTENQTDENTNNESVK